MKNSRIYAMGSILLTTVLALFSCSGGSNTPDAEVAKTVKIVADDFSKIHYFSFEKGAEVVVSNEKTDKNWDIAFNYYYPRTNGGVTGSGAAGVCMTDKLNMSEVTEIPATNLFVSDTKIKVMKSTKMPPVYVEDNGNPELRKWIAFDLRAKAYTYDNHVFVIRTGNNKYAKVIMKSFADGNGKFGTITMEYVYPFVVK